MPDTKTNIKSLSWLCLLGVITSAVYGVYLHNPLVFDDVYFFDGTVHKEFLGAIFLPQLRWLPYATFEWTRAVFGLDIVWFRIGNLTLHLANAFLLFFFLRHLFEANQQAEGKESDSRSFWLAMCGSAIFALHPASVYAVAYLTQRSILMAVFFSLAMLIFWLRGLETRRPLLLWLSALAYFFAVMSKEHAVMAPSVVLALTVLMRKRNDTPARQWAPVFILYAAIAIYTVFKVKAGYNLLGTAYQTSGPELLERMVKADPGFKAQHAYVFSIITQCWLFFKYLLIWLVPVEGRMSIDIYEPFALRLWSLPQTVGAVAFIAYGVLAARLLWSQGLRGLLGFGMLCPWLLFFTEFSTVRVADPLVIYRSYLWMACSFAILPWFCQRMTTKHIVLGSAAIAVLLIPPTLLRLQTFSSNWLLWNDAVRHVEGKPVLPGVERVYFNRANAASRLGRYADSIPDYNFVLELQPRNPHAYNDRGAARLHLNDVAGAKSDFENALRINPDAALPHRGMAKIYELEGLASAAREEYRIACRLGNTFACKEFSGEIAHPLSSLGH